MRTILASLFFSFHLPFCLQAQHQSVNDSSAGKMPHRPLGKAWLAVPVVMTGYGLISLKSKDLQQVNRNVQQAVWVDRPHNRTHLDNYLQFSPAVAVFALDLAGVKAKHPLKERLFVYGLAELVSTGVVQAGKRLSAEWRPDSSSNRSFPSGHTATAFAAAEMLRREYGQRSPWYAVAGYAAAAATGYLRIYNNKHWLGDVIAGAGIGILSTDFAYCIYPHLQKLFGKKQTASVIILPTWQNGQPGVALLRYF